MAGIRVLITCPKCRLLIRFDHAITSKIEPDGHIQFLLDQRAMGMHDCLRGDE